MIPVPLHLTEAALAEVKRLRHRRPEAHLYLRIGLTSAGCAGLSYTLALESHLGPADQVFRHADWELVIDRQHLPHLSGLRVDYSEDLLGGSFRFDNPNAQRHCNCGQSFALKA